MYGSPRVEVRILDFSQKAMGVPECVGAGLGWASVKLGCIGDRAVLVEEGESRGSLLGGCR